MSEVVQTPIARVYTEQHHQTTKMRQSPDSNSFENRHDEDDQLNTKA